MLFNTIAKNANKPWQYVAAGTEQWLSSSPQLLVYTPAAARKQLEVIGWKRSDYPKNRTEQGGLLFGYYVQGASGQPVQGVVTEIVEANAACRLPGYIEWDAMEDIRLQRQFFVRKEELAAQAPDAAEKLCIMGWWHTHPNDLDVFLSSTDMETVRLKYNKPEKYSVVLNPHRGLFRAFAGADALDVPVVMLLDGKTRPQPLAEPGGKPEKVLTQLIGKRKKHRRKRK